MTHTFKFPKFMIILNYIINENPEKIIDIAKENKITYCHTHLVIKQLEELKLLTIKKLKRKRVKIKLTTKGIHIATITKELIGEMLKCHESKIHEHSKNGGF